MPIPNGVIVHSIANILLEHGLSVADTMRLALQITNKILALQARYPATKVQDLIQQLQPGESDPRD